MKATETEHPPFFSILAPVLVLCLMIFPLSICPVSGETTFTQVYGKVVDASTGKPISEAHVFFSYGKTKVYNAETDSLGTYSLMVEGSLPFPYAVYAYCNRSSTVGFDYVPAYKEVSVGEKSLNISFRLLPGASIEVTGDFGPYESLLDENGLEAYNLYAFTVIDQHGLLNRTNAENIYGEYRLVNHVLDLKRSIIVPSNMPVKVRVDVYYIDGSEFHFVIDGEGHDLNLTQGAKLTINLRNLALRAEVESGLIHTRLGSVQAEIDEAETVGFFLGYEKSRLLVAQSLVEAARDALARDDFDSAYADIREAYIILEGMHAGLQQLYVNASLSTFFIVPFTGFTVVILASLLLDDRRERLAVSIILYCVLSVLIYLFYPGYVVLPKTIYAPLFSTTLKDFIGPLLSFISLVVSLSVLMLRIEKSSMKEGLSRVSAAAAVFSIAVRSLRRRKLRVTLTLISMFVLVFAFINLTSIEHTHGLSVQPLLTPKGSTEGFIVWNYTGLSIEHVHTHEHESPPVLPFSIQPAVLQWLRKFPETTVMAPKMESIPQQINPSLNLSVSTDLFYLISGALGVYPGLECEFTKMDRIISQGRFLRDDELNGVLISEEAARHLGVQVNDTLHLSGKRLTLTGIFNSHKFDVLKDLDGNPVAPQSQGLGYCAGSECIIIHWETAQWFSWMVMSRIDVKTQSPQDLIPLARKTVLNWPGLWAWVSAEDRVYRISTEPYLEVMGVPSLAVLLVLVILNIGAVMLSAVYERRGELAVMSSLGLNPDHISAIFIAEAIVMGTVAGTLGYILDLLSYRFMTVFAVSLGMKQKVDAIWGILVLCFSIMAALLGSAIPAYKSSIVTTPSLQRKWEIKEKPQTPEAPWILEMPIRVPREELEEIFNFLKEGLQKHTSSSIEGIEDLIFNREANPMTIRISFTYIYTFEEKVVTKNELFPAEILPNQYSIKLASKYQGIPTETSEEAKIWRTASFVRRLILEYSRVHKA